MGIKSKNSLLNFNQSKSSTVDRKTQGRHVSREPWAPGTPGPRSICGSFWTYTKQSHAPQPPPPTPRFVRPFCVNSDYSCLPCRAEFTLHTVGCQIWLKFLSEWGSAWGAHSIQKDGIPNVTQSDNVITHRLVYYLLFNSSNNFWRFSYTRFFIKHES